MLAEPLGFQRIVGGPFVVARAAKSVVSAAGELEMLGADAVIFDPQDEQALVELMSQVCDGVAPRRVGERLKGQALHDPGADGPGAGAGRQMPGDPGAAAGVRWCGWS